VNVAKELDKFKLTYIDNIMSCKDTCFQYKAQKPPNASRYGSGQKRCQICEIYLKWDGLFCPCCGCKLRVKPRNRHWKVKLLYEKKRY